MSDMPMPRVTFSGIDATVSLDDIMQFAQEDHSDVPVEFAVLYSNDRNGSYRYPSAFWIDGLLSLDLPNLTLALHVCGKSTVTDFFHNAGTISRIAGNFDRIQINFDWHDHPLQSVTDVLTRYPNKTIITQHNLVNMGLHDKLMEYPNHAVLFDSSLGMGKTPVDWPVYIHGRHCGYAGGLSPDNLPIELHKIEYASYYQPYWIDMETGIRDRADKFSLEKIRRVIQHIREFDKVKKKI